MATLFGAANTLKRLLQALGLGACRATSNRSTSISRANMLREVKEEDVVKLAVSLTQALADPELFGKVFAAASFWTWRVWPRSSTGCR